MYVKALTEVYQTFASPERVAIMLGNTTSWLFAFLSAEKFAFFAAGLASLSTAVFMLCKIILLVVATQKDPETAEEKLKKVIDDDPEV
tara:strand:+ start:775 stop:1038 length:264 start_codon:yes stop_codon:yes gene_type:complete